ncbi:cytochrome c3 family protein [Haliangium sp.]|uniref:cytochrome c3 family protein n=1 Tax=Haliangium sp. TaxID=2663208 RepID=UPI003D0EACA0
MSAKRILFIVATAVVLGSAVAAAAWVTPRYYERELSQYWPVRQAAWADSTTCRACHPDQHASWHRTFHRTMTQEATRTSVRGRFDGQPVTYWGGTIRPYQQDGRFFFDYLDPNTGERQGTREVVRTVGSRRYQQYLSYDEATGTYHRLQMLWHIDDQRWVHMNGVFLGHDDNGFDSQVAVWNTGCIMCHNTGPVPGVSNWDEITSGIISGERSMQQGVSFEFESQVAEIGISCGSCHGPGSAHAKRNRNPFRRYLLHLSDRRDPTIINPATLDKVHATDLCGQCHGQRLPKSQSMVTAWTETGPSFRAGDALDEHVNVLTQDSKPLYKSHDPEMFKLRFWGDSTPRLTAYELQGIRMSACYQQGELTCTSCHTMHGGDVRGMLPPEHRSKAACSSCHSLIAANVPEHTRHRIDSAGSDCFACHMPKMVYGIMEIHRSHHIEIPDPGRDAANARPNACTSCHLDQTLAWAGNVVRQWWGGGYEIPSARADGNDPAVADTVASLLGGDPVQRAVAARLAGRADAAPPIEVRALLIPHLLTAMKRDSYPAVRRFAQKSLAQIATELAAAGTDLGMAELVDEFDFIAAPAERLRVIEALEERWAKAPKDALPEPAPALLLDAGLTPRWSEVERLIEQAAARSQEVNIGE